MDINIIVHDLLNAGVTTGGNAGEDGENSGGLAITILARMLEKALEDYVLKEDFSEFVNQLKALQTIVNQAVTTLETVKAESASASKNADNALTIALDVKARMDKLVLNPPKDGKSAFEIANDLRPEGHKFESEQDWIDYIENIREEKILQVLSQTRIYIQDKALTIRVKPADWIHSKDSNGGYTCTLHDSKIKANQDIELINCRGGSKKFFDIMKRAVCDSMADGEICIYIPECDAPADTVELDFILRECVLKKEAKA